MQPKLLYLVILCLVINSCGYLVPTSVPKPGVDPNMEIRRSAAFNEIMHVREALDAAELVERSMLKITAPDVTADLSDLSAITVARRSLEEMGPFFASSVEDKLTAKSIVTEKYPHQFSHLGVFPRDVAISLDSPDRTSHLPLGAEPTTKNTAQLELTDKNGTSYPYILSSSKILLDGRQQVSLHLEEIEILHNDIRRGQPTSLSDILRSTTPPGRFDLVIGGDTRYIRANQLNRPLGDLGRLFIQVLDAKIDSNNHLNIAETKMCLYDKNDKLTCTLNTPPAIEGRFYYLKDILVACQDVSQLTPCANERENENVVTTRE